VPNSLATLEYILFSVFFLELCVRFYVERLGALNNLYTVADIVVVCTSVAEYILNFCGLNVGLSNVRALRLVRMMKLVRVVYRVPFFVELRKLMYMISCCMKTLFWSFLVLGVVMTAWSIVAVEVVHPRVVELSLEGRWPDCERCARAFSSVFHSNVTFFQTIVAGDSWGLMAIPVIEAHPWTAVIFAGTLLTLVFGVLNVIVAVVVDAFAEARTKDVFTRARELQWEEEEEKKRLSAMFGKMDTDGNGSLDIDELKDGAKKVEQFSHWLRVLDIDGRDLEDMFCMLDRDGSGDIDKNEFVEWMYRMKNTDSKTAAQFVKQKLCSFEEKVHAQDDDLDLRLSEVSQLLAQSVRQSESLYRGIDEGLAEVRKQVMDSVGAALALLEPRPRAEPSVPPSQARSSFLLLGSCVEPAPSCHGSPEVPSLEGGRASGSPGSFQTPPQHPVVERRRPRRLQTVTSPSNFSSMTVHAPSDSPRRNRIGLLKPTRL